MISKSLRERLFLARDSVLQGPVRGKLVQECKERLVSKMHSILLHGNFVLVLKIDGKVTCIFIVLEHDHDHTCSLARTMGVLS